ncbi:hypothetical protein CO044_04370 [Candidatus Peregrinibacteria bacterium CG_4_9_14_0_2_um_filter_38_9]|nr:MAG: hypothetical protein CO044_04370 [Candidatus Peregrinibacteria bacterium CG_4_9_14_0_2_um_filter_38_9]
MNKSELHKKFVKLGREKSHISHQLLAILPEIYEKSVFFDYGCSSIYEYAARFGDGLSAGVVDKVLKLKENLANCPSLFETVATQGVHKVAIIASLANTENEKELVAVVENMNKDAVQEYSKTKRGKKMRIVTKIEMDEEMEFLFLKLKKKLKTASNKETMKRLLQALNMQFFPEEKSKNQQIKPTCKENVGGGGDLEDRGETVVRGNFLEENMGGGGGGNFLEENMAKQTASRYIPVAVKKLVLQKSKGRCEYNGCNRPIDNLHHLDGYSKTKNHDNLVGLCEIHHQFAHNGVDKPLEKMDLLYRQHRQMAVSCL